jgi:UDP-N-acetylglucosamine--N-acetylmuramyl-(pentapeptide) pyrophosphoryl-undecaprenol N-acetylglucosamine transferase
MPAHSSKPFVAIACGGTGGHLFPGLAVAEALLARGSDVLLLVSPKEVDQQAVQSATGVHVAVLPAVGLTRGRWGQFVTGFWNSFRTAKKLFRQRPPQAVLGMGGFTSAPPVLAGKACGAVTFLHESNTIPGRANRWLAHVVDQAFVGFPSTVGRLHHVNIVATGTPVRAQFQPADADACRLALGLLPGQPVLLVMGGSQGASGINELVLQALPALTDAAPELQFIHLTGPNDLEKVRSAYAAHPCRAMVRAFLTEMELALGAATLAVSRAGASTQAEVAAVRRPAILVPYPFAADNHQFHNARALVDAGAALLLEQETADGRSLAALVLDLLRDEARRIAMSEAAGRLHSPHAAEMIAEKMLELMKAISHGHWSMGGETNEGRASIMRDPQSALP